MLAPMTSRFCLNLCTGARQCAPRVFQLSKRLAGHSHWQNVKATKEAKDREKAKAAQLYSRLVTQAIRNGGGSRDPKMNQRLASVLAQAKASSVPFSSLEKALKADNVVDPYIVEVQAPGGLLVLLETCAKSAAAERQKIHSIAKRYGCTALSTSSVSKEFFAHIGLIAVDPQSHPELAEEDAATSLGIEIGASEVIRNSSESGHTLEFHCEPFEVDGLSSELERRGVTVLSAEDTYVPKNRVTVLPEVYRNLQEMYSKIRDQHEMVERIFDNVAVADEVDGTLAAQRK